MTGIPLSVETVWLLMTERCNEAEIAEAFGVCPLVARAAMLRAAKGVRDVLHLPEVA